MESKTNQEWKGMENKKNQETQKLKEQVKGNNERTGWVVKVKVREVYRQGREWVMEQIGMEREKSKGEGCDRKGTDFQQFLFDK